ncbi:MAG: hypothetical protein IJ282_04005 [Lachnospiraceae bacterium]|nr:hypothetical protein [Lachnospiraceae bacterium]
MKKKKYVFILLAGILLLFLLWDTPIRERNAQETGDSCGVYYLLNIDGMKGLGHTALLLTDEQGKGFFYSYNGMQYSLGECLMGKAGVGKMKVFALSGEEVEEFLTTGNLQVEDAAECDNFDRILYRYISSEDYTLIQESAAKYIDTGDEYERLYGVACNASEGERAIAEKALNEFLTQVDLPKYQIYVHNCDTVARELMALIDQEVASYNAEDEKLTPTDNYIGMYKKLSETWGCRVLGADTMVENFFGNKKIFEKIWGLLYNTY